MRPGGDITVDKDSNGRLVAFIVNNDNAVSFRQTTAGAITWTAWTYLGASARANADPVVALNDNGRLVCFIVNNDNAVYLQETDQCRQQYMDSMDLPWCECETRW